MTDPQLRIHKFIRRLKSPDYFVRLRAGCRLGHMGPAAKEAIPTLLEMLHSGSQQDRKLVAWTLGCIGVGALEATPALRTAVQDSDEAVRTMAASALEKIDAAAKRAAA